MTTSHAELAAFRGALLRARSPADVAAAMDAFVRCAPDDAAARAEAEADARSALELVGGLESAREMPRLRSALAARDALVRNAGDALMRDAAELVSVIGELERKDALLKADLQQALRFQRAMIAPLPTHEALALESLYLAAEVISGDFYDVIALDADRLRFFIADAAGHGIAAGLATMFIKSEYEAYKRSAAPANVLRLLNDHLTTTYRNLALRFSALCVDVYPTERRVRYACAAHPGPLIVSSGGARVLPSGGPFVGMLAGVDFPERDVDLAVGDLTAMYTDGLPDALDAEGKQFGDTRVTATLVAARTQGIDVCPLLVRALGDFVGAGRALVDDVAIVTFQLVA